MRLAVQSTQALQVLLVTALARTTAAMAIRRIPHPPHRLTELATAMGRITAAVAIHPQAMQATAILLTAMLATALLLMAMTALTARAIAPPVGWRSIEPAGAEAGAQKSRTRAEVRQPRDFGTSREVPTAKREEEK